MKIQNQTTIRNPFHNTEVTLRPVGGTISARTMSKARRALCPVSGCRCFSSPVSGSEVVTLLQAVPNRDGSRFQLFIGDN